MFIPRLYEVLNSSVWNNGPKAGLWEDEKVSHL